MGERSKVLEEREKDGERKESTAKLNSVNFLQCFLSNKMRDCVVKAKLTKPNKTNSK